MDMQKDKETESIDRWTNTRKGTHTEAQAKRDTHGKTAPCVRPIAPTDLPSASLHNNYARSIWQSENKSFTVSIPNQRTN